jgi:putative hydrolase of the HAD superfamily
MKKKAVFFDLDKTLYDNVKPREGATKAVYKVFSEHHKITFEEFYGIYGRCRSEIHKELQGTASSFNRALYFKRLFEETHTTFDPTLILKMYETYWNTFLSNIKPFPETVPMLKELKKMGVKTAIITNLTVYTQLRKVERLGISEYIDLFVTSEEAGKNKPHPAPFNFTLNKMNLRAKEAMMVGDRVDSDIEGANAAGIDSVLITKEDVEDFPEGDPRKPDHVIKNLMDLLKLVK